MTAATAFRIRIARGDAVVATAGRADHRGRDNTPCAIALRMLHCASDADRTRKMETSSEISFGLGFLRGTYRRRSCIGSSPGTDSDERN